MSPFYVTTPIYYVNSTPHVGHAYTTVLADVLAAYHRLLGVPTWYLTGTDEHGEKAQLAAEARGVPVQQLCDEYSDVFRALHLRFDVHFDDFIRTTEERHKKIVVRVLEKLWAQGDLYKANYEGWYCTRCETFFTDTEVQENAGNCPTQPVLHGAIKKVSEENYFFRLSKYAPALRTAVERGEIGIIPERRTNEILGLVKGDVPDLCISRHSSRVSWGIPLPFDPQFICYVWIDALFNYKTAIGYLSDDASERARHERWWSGATHVLGKDILKHHSLIWWALLLAVLEPLPKRVYVHGWFVDSSGLKVSKTKAAAAGGDPSAVDLRDQLPGADQLLDVLGVDVARYVLATAMRPGDDSQLNWRIVKERSDADLANGFGNSVNRVVKMAHQFCGGKFPGLGGGGPRGEQLRSNALALIDAVRAVPATLDLFAVTTAVRAVISELSLYLDDEKPWKLGKDPASLPRVGGILADALEALRIVGLALTPIMPGKCAELRVVLGLPETVSFDAEAAWSVLQAGAPLKEPPGLFPRFDDERLTRVLAG